MDDHTIILVGVELVKPNCVYSFDTEFTYIRCDTYLFI
jgi:hypothetical protein